LAPYGKDPKESLDKFYYAVCEAIRCDYRAGLENFDDMCHPGATDYNNLVLRHLDESVNMFFELLESDKTNNYIRADLLDAMNTMASVDIDAFEPYVERCCGLLGRFIEKIVSLDKQDPVYEEEMYIQICYFLALFYRDYNERMVEIHKKPNGNLLKGPCT
jgi:hypothetical protein